MAAGKLENERAMMLSHRWAIGTLFSSDKVSQGEVESFLRFGIASHGDAEPRSAEIDEKVAEILRTGKVSF